MRLLEITLYEIDQFVCRLRLWRTGLNVLTEHVAANMTLDDFCHKAVKGSSAGSEKLQYGGAFLFLLKGSFERLYLTLNSGNAFQELFLVSSSVGHSIYYTPLYYINTYPRAIEFRRRHQARRGFGPFF